MTTPSLPPKRDPEKIEQLHRAIDDVIVKAEGDPTRASGKRVHELINAALKLFRDGSNLGEIKLLNRSFREVRYALKVFRPYEDIRKVSIYGSARTPIDHPDYIAAAEFARHLAAAGWMIITGAGDGIMRAGHDGAALESSFGVSISLPFETNANDIIKGDHKLINFKYFFTRKLTFMWQSHAIALFPGGFGTQDEGFEALTLIQTGKAPIMPVVMVDAPGGDYWKHWENYIEHSLLKRGWIGEDDPNLYFITDDPAAAAKHVMDFYRNYHSARFVHDTQVLRMHRPLTPEQVEKLNDEFSSLLKSGEIEQRGPLPEERRAFQNLPRLAYESTKRDYGTLRLMIDRINQYDLENAAIG